MNSPHVCADKPADGALPIECPTHPEAEIELSGDRRNNGRAKLGRRRSLRTILFTDVCWGELGAQRAKRGVIVGISDHGLAMLTECADTPRPGSRIQPRKHGRRARWFRKAVVTRTQSLSDSLDLVAAAFPTTPAADGH